MLQMVAEFQKASQQPVSNKPNIGSKYILRWELMQEENKEYLDACKQNDKVEVLDALIDQMYVLLGTINNHGMQHILNEAFNRVHTNNMSKVVNGSVLRSASGKTLKPKGFKSVELKDLF